MAKHQGSDRAPTLVIGGGIGGLAAALALTRRGGNVLLLEAAMELGGTLRPYSWQGFRFHSGLTMVGRPALDLLSELGVDATTLFTEISANAHNVFRIGQAEVSLCAGRLRQQEQFKCQFPKDAKGIERLFRDLERLERCRSAYANYVLSRIGWRDMARALDIRWIRQLESSALTDYMESVVADPILRATFYGIATILGMPPSRINAASGLMVYLHFSDGAYYPRGGSAGLVAGLANAIVSSGGTIRTNACVERIVVDNQRVIAVELNSGERISADRVVSAIDPELTHYRLLRGQRMPNKLSAQLAGSCPSLGAVVICLGLNKSLKTPETRWYFDTPDIESIYAPLLMGQPSCHYAAFGAPNSLKDLETASMPTTGPTFELVGYGPPPPTALWMSQPRTAAERAFDRYKSDLAERLLAGFERGFPGSIDGAEFRCVLPELGDNLRCNAVTLRPHGPLLTMERTGRERFKTRSHVRGLYRAGFSVMGSGVGNCVLSGMVAAQQVSRDSDGFTPPP